MSTIMPHYIACRRWVAVAFLGLLPMSVGFGQTEQAAQEVDREKSVAVQIKDDAQPSAEEPPAGFDVRREELPRGRMQIVDYESLSLGSTRRAVIYTPPNYQPDQTYPVLYLLHGIGDTEMGWWRKGDVDIILDNLIADKLIEPLIVVMPNGRAGRTTTVDSPRSAQFTAFAAFEDDLLQDLVPYVDQHYAVKADRNQRALAGLSMGGGQSLNFGLGHLDVFSWIGAFSPAPNAKAVSELIPQPARTIEKLNLLWLSCGDSDRLMNISKSFHEGLEIRNVPHVWHVNVGGHTWPVWKRDLYFFIQRIFR